MRAFLALFQLDVAVVDLKRLRRPPQPRSSKLFAAMILAMCRAAGSFNIAASVAMAPGPCSRNRWCTSTSNFLSWAVFPPDVATTRVSVREGLGSL